MQVNFTLSDGTQTQVDVQVQDPQTIKSVSFSGVDGVSHTLQESQGTGQGPSKVTITNQDGTTTDFSPAGAQSGTSATSGDIRPGETVTIKGVDAGQGQPNPGQQSQ